MYIVLEVPDNFDSKKKFASKDIIGCGNASCGYYTINLKLLVNHLFHDPRHGNLPFVVSKRDRLGEPSRLA